MINFAVIGRNFITDWFLEAAKEFDELHFYGVYSRKIEHAKEYAAAKGAKTVYSSIADMCKDEKLDMVYIASPNIFHEVQAISLLKAKKHVLCEKPVTLSSESLSKILDAADKNKCIFMEAMVPLHMPVFAKIKELIPNLGIIRHISLNFCQYSSRYHFYKENVHTNTFDPSLGNGAFMDLGIYCSELLLALFGYPDSIKGTAHILPDSIDGSGTLSLSYHDKTASIVFSKISQSMVQSEIQGENGSLLIDKISRPKKLTLILRNEEPILIDTTPKRHEMAYEIENFISQINGTSMPFYNDISQLAMKFCDTALKELGISFFNLSK